MPTISDVANAAGVSKATVSRVLNGNPTVDAALAKRVQRAMKTLSYQPSRLAQGLRNGHTRVLGLIIPDIRNTVYTELFSGIERCAYAEGYSVVLCNSFDSAERESQLLDMSVAERFAGILLVSAPSGGTDLGRVMSANMPLVAVDRRLTTARVDTVLVNNNLGTAMAVEHLIAQGFRRIAFLSGPRSVFTGEERLAGYRQGLRTGRLRFKAELVRYGDFQQASGRAGMQALLQLPHPPDAVICANSLMTAGALEAIRTADCRIPDDIGVVGFDQTPWSTLVSPQLTTIEQPMFEVGRNAANLLLERIRGHQGPARELTLSPSLNPRDSTLAAEPQRLRG